MHLLCCAHSMSMYIRLSARPRRQAHIAFATEQHLNLSIPTPLKCECWESKRCQVSIMTKSLTQSCRKFERWLTAMHKCSIGCTTSWTHLCFMMLLQASTAYCLLELQLHPGAPSLCHKEPHSYESHINGSLHLFLLTPCFSASCILQLAARYLFAKKEAMFLWPAPKPALPLPAAFLAALESTPPPAFRLTPPLLFDLLVAAAASLAPCTGFSSGAGSATCMLQGHCGSSHVRCRHKTANCPAICKWLVVIGTGRRENASLQHGLMSLCYLQSMRRAWDAVIGAVHKVGGAQGVDWLQWPDLDICRRCSWLRLCVLVHHLCHLLALLIVGGPLHLLPSWSCTLCNPLSFLAWEHRH